MADTRCGVGKLKQSSFCQHFASLFWFSIVTAVLTLTITAMYSYLSSIQTTTQIVFSLNATDLGIFYAMFEVGSVLSNVLTTYFLARKHTPRILSLATSMIMVSCVILAAPHFFADFEDKLQTTTKNRTADDLISRSLCRNSSSPMMEVNETSTSVPSSDDEPRSTQSLVILILMCIAGFINGVGYAPTYALVTSYLDNNAPDGQSSKYIAVFLASYSLGPIAGFGLGAVLLNFYITFESTYLTPEDDEWLGAWWLGYAIFAAILLVTTPLLGLFPKRMPGLDAENASSYTFPSTESLELEEKNCEDFINKESSEEDDTIRSFKGLLPTFWKLITNPLYMLESFGSCAAAYYVAGWVGYLPKYFEEQFLLSATMASVLAGVLPPVIGAPLIMLSGYVVSKYKLTMQQDAKLVFICIFGGTLCMIPLFFVNCEQYPTQDLPANLTQCTAGCGCMENDYTAVCLDGVSYKSPCLSGCTDYFTQDNQIVYTGCFCESNITMTKGICQEEGCISAWVYTACTIISTCFTVCCATSAVTILMRSVPKEDKSFAIGVQSALASLTAWIPSPVLYGTVIDSTCQVWEYPDGAPDNPEFYGYCLEYDNYQYMLRYVGISIGAMGLSSLLFGLGWWVSYFPRYQQTEEEPEVREGNNNHAIEEKTSGQ